MAQEMKTTQASLRPKLSLPHDVGQSDNSSPATASTTRRSISHVSDSLTTTTSSGRSLELSSTTTTSDSVYSTTSKKLRVRIKHRIDNLVSWRHQRKSDTGAETHPEISWPSTLTEQHSSSSFDNDDNRIPGLDSLTLSRAELNLLSRMQTAYHTARTTRERSQDIQEVENQRLDIFIEKRFGCSTQHVRPLLD